MRTTATVFLLATALVFSTGCETRTARTDGGGVLLSVSEIDDFPIVIAANGLAPEFLRPVVVQAEITIDNIPKDPLGATGDLMNVELRSYEVVYTRADRGTRIPPRLVRGAFGVVPVGGTLTFEGLPMMDLEQLDSPPLSDLLFENGGFDKETNETKISVNFSIRFFGRTLSGDAVETRPTNITVDFIP